jgi:capsular polysaccharide transport system permease protein
MTGVYRYTQRSSLSITLAVWRALFIREVLTRFSIHRAGWIWILLEPVLLIGITMVIWGVFRVKDINGINPGVFTMLGVLGFFTVQKTTTKSLHAIRSNSSLFTYRQVLPVDTILVRAAVEACILLMTMLVVMACLFMLGFEAVPEKIGQVLFAFGSLWGIGLGLGLLLSALQSLVSEIHHVVEVMFRPLYFFSAVHIPVSLVPYPYRGWLLLNPLVHGIELLRGGFYHQLQPVPGVSAFYLANWVLVLVLLGLALHYRFSDRLVAD